MKLFGMVAWVLLCAGAAFGGWIRPSSSGIPISLAETDPHFSGVSNRIPYFESGLGYSLGNGFYLQTVGAPSAFGLYFVDPSTEEYQYPMTFNSINSNMQWLCDFAMVGRWIRDGNFQGTFFGDGSGLENITAAVTAGVHSVTCDSGLINSGTEADPVLEISESDPVWVVASTGYQQKAATSIALGAGSSVTGANQIAIGSATVFGLSGVSIGDGAVQTGSYGVAIGRDASAKGRSVAIGRDAVAGEYQIAIGDGATADLASPAGIYTTEIGSGTATMNGYLHYRGYPIVNPVGVHYGSAALLTNIPAAKLTGEIPTNVTLSYASVTNPPVIDTIHHYLARSTSGSEVWVTASALGVTAELSGTVMTYTIPGGCKLIASQIRVPAGTGTTLTIDVGTTWYANTGWANRWGMSAVAYREDTGAQITSVSTKLSPTTFAQGQVLGLNNSVVSRVCVSFQ